MKTEEIRQISTNYYIATTVMAEELKFCAKKCFAVPAAVGVDNSNLKFVSSEDDDGLHVSFYNEFGLNSLTVTSRYAKGEYIYVREPYFIDEKKVCYACDDPMRCFREKGKMMAARYMPKKHARTFLKVSGVCLKRMNEIDVQELERFGFNNYRRLFSVYDAGLSENEYEYSCSEKNPYVFIYEVERVVSDEETERMKGGKRDIQWYKERGLPVPGSWHEAAVREREKERARCEKYIMEAAEQEPAFARMLAAVKEREAEDV